MQQLQNELKLWILQKFLNLVEEFVSHLDFLSDQDKFTVTQMSLKFINHIFNNYEEETVYAFSKEAK